MTDSQRLDIEEANYLSQIEQQYVQLTVYVRNFIYGKNLMGACLAPNEILELISLYRGNENYFKSYIGVAQQLDQAGKPQLLMRLTQILNDIQNSIRIYENMYQNLLNHERMRVGIMNNTLNYGTNVMSQVTDNMKRIL